MEVAVGVADIELTGVERVVRGHAFEVGINARRRRGGVGRVRTDLVENLE